MSATAQSHRSEAVLASSPSRRRSGLLAVTATALLWGTTGTAATFAPQVGPLAIGAFSLGVAGILQGLVGVPSLRRNRGALIQGRGALVIGALAVFVYPLAFYSSMSWAGVAIGSVVSLSSAPLASGLLERVWDGVPLDRWWMVAAGLGIVGSTMLCLSEAEGPGSSLVRVLGGIALGLLAGTSYATYSWSCHRLMGQGIPRPAAMGAVFGAGGVLLMPVLLFTGGQLISDPGPLAVGIYMALVPMFLGYLLFGVGLTRIPASTATAVTLLEPAAATVLAVLVVGEHLTAIGWCGLAVMGFVLAVLSMSPATQGEQDRLREAV